jgi:SAM-dependent methyltransferase
MPELDWNRSYWDGGYEWTERGEEWSLTWGGSAPQWHGSIAPRLNRRLPARAILEIAPGYGRWTSYLLPLCQEFLGIDLSAECVAACRDRFRAVPHARFAQNDGLSLAGIPDDHFDLVFTYDSLVHAEADVLASYVPQILRKLNAGGVAFIHHANLAALPPSTQNLHARAAAVSAETMAHAIAQAGGKTLVQERINWGQPELNDCFTLFARRDHPDQSPAAQIENHRYMEEAVLIRATQAAWHR